MAVYEYKCSVCKYEAVLNEKMDAKRVKDCPLCRGRKTLERQVSRSSFILRGAGWYNKAKE